MASESELTVVRLRRAHGSFRPGADIVVPAGPGPVLPPGTLLFQVDGRPELAATVVDLAAGHPWLVRLDDFEVV